MKLAFGPRGGEEQTPFVSGHWQNLNDEHERGEGWRPPSRLRKVFDRRGWLRVGWGRPPLADFSWQVVVQRRIKRWEFGWHFDTMGYSDEWYGVTACLGPVVLYTHLTSRLLPKPKRSTNWRLKIGFSEHALPDIEVHYSFGTDDWSMSTGRRKWNRRRSGMFWCADKLFGRFDYHVNVLDRYDAVIPLPERPYTVHVTVEEGIRKRPRWPFASKEIHASIDAKDDPLPEPGNMESDWWNGEDAIYGMGVKAGTRAEVVGRVVEHVLAARVRHGGRIDWKPKDDHRPKPSGTEWDAQLGRVREEA